MSHSNNVTFSRRLRGFLSPSWFNRTTSAGRVGAAKSLSLNAIEPVDSAFSVLSENYQSPDHMDGFEAVTRQVLANDVLDVLIQLQAEMAFGDMLQEDPEKVMHAYHRARETAREHDQPFFTPR